MIRFRKTQEIDLPILVIPLDRLPETCADCPCARIVSDVEESGVDYCTAEFRELMPSYELPEWCPAYPGVIETDQSFFNQDNLQKFNEGTNGRHSKKENKMKDDESKKTHATKSIARSILTITHIFCQQSLVICGCAYLADLWFNVHVKPYAVGAICLVAIGAQIMYGLGAVSGDRSEND